MNANVKERKKPVESPLPPRETGSEVPPAEELGTVALLLSEYGVPDVEALPLESLERLVPTTSPAALVELLIRSFPIGAEALEARFPMMPEAARPLAALAMLARALDLTGRPEAAGFWRDVLDHLLEAFQAAQHRAFVEGEETTLSA